MPEIRPEWLAQLRALDDKADLRFNHAVGRYEFILTSADGVPRSQFWCQFDGERDPVTGLKPYRALDEAGMQEALRNLERSFVGNPYDGAGTTRREVRRRYTYNEDLRAKKYRDAGAAVADFIWEHRRQIRDAGAGPLVRVG